MYEFVGEGGIRSIPGSRVKRMFMASLAMSALWVDVCEVVHEPGGVPVAAASG